MSDLYRLVYASKNLLQGPEPEAMAAVRQILDASQRNNAALDVTGALMFNAGVFAQVLEGPRRGVEATFERIQRDLRHDDVTVLQCGPAESRGFANWSMAFVGESRSGQARFSGLATESGFDLARLDGDRVFAMLHSLVLEEEGLPAVETEAAGTNPAKIVSEPRAASGLDVAQVRAEIAQLRPEPALQVAAPPPDAPDRAPPAGPLRVALAASEDRLEALRDERDLWAGRAGLLARAMAQEAEGVRAAAPGEADALPPAMNGTRAA
ncbi:blue light sensor protein [Methylobacterium oryzae]|uniref:BLUF domain-containing protein n=1 Tax=Methylobacterium oryzae TaxID=334852 RepID=UPI002F2CF9E9